MIPFVNPTRFFFAPLKEAWPMPTGRGVFCVKQSRQSLNTPNVDYIPEFPNVDYITEQTGIS